MKIISTSNTRNNKQIPASLQVNRIGKSIYKSLPSAFKFSTSPNTFDIYFTLLFALPTYTGKNLVKSQGEIQEVTINISITTYKNKIRVNTIEVTPLSRTLGFDLFEPKEVEDLPKAKEVILEKVLYRVEKAYADYDILY